MEASGAMFKRKPLHRLMQEAEGTHGLRRALSAMNLVSLGIGCIIGTGIFVLTGTAAANYAGPAIVLSFVIAGIACVFAGLCYAELASMIPVSGSAYTYAYATMGEIVAWIIGWDLILEYLFGASTVAVGWSGYVASFMKDCGLVLPAALTTATWHEVPGGGTAFGATINLPAMLAIAVLTGLLVIGIRESAWFNNIIVVVKLAVIVMFIAFGCAYVQQANWHPFIPDNTGALGQVGWSGFVQAWHDGGFGGLYHAFDQHGGWGHFGWLGLMRGAAVVFFAYIGFDAVSTAAQEAKNPQRDMPIGILGSLVVCTVLYILVSLVATGMVNYTQLDTSAPIATAVDAAGPGLAWLRPFIKLGAIAGLTSVMLVLLLGQTRISFSMSRDGLLPQALGKVHPRFKTPYVTTIVTGLAAMVFAGMCPLSLLAELVSIGTLLAFVLVCLGVWILRRRHPEAKRAFRTPWVPVVPILGVVFALALMLALPLDTWLRLVIWMAIGFVIFFTYSRRHSRLQIEHRAAQAENR
jgi:APA family basic amino acid/polyamine antiporter